MQREKFEWTPACEQAFQDLKSYLTTPPCLSSLKEGEVLQSYLVVSGEAVVLVIVREEAKIQKPVY